MDFGTRTALEAESPLWWKTWISEHGPAWGPMGSLNETVVFYTKKIKNRKECKWSTLCLSTTGITGPTGGGIEKPIGLVWFGFSGPEGLKRQKKIFKGSRVNIRELATDWALYILIRLSAK